MKKIINGKKYDTDTAKELAKWESPYAVNDFHYYEETLCLKRTGEYFIYGEGNAASAYNKRVSDNSWTGGEDIKPLTEDEARSWAEERLDADEYEGIFGEAEE